MPILEISVIPVGTNTPSFSSSVTDAVRLIKQKGLAYQITPTATVIQGEMDQLMEVAKEIHANALRNGVQRVITHMSIDDRQDKEIQLDQQVSIVEQSLS